MNHSYSSRTTAQFEDKLQTGLENLNGQMEFRICGRGAGKRGYSNNRTIRFNNAEELIEYLTENNSTDIRVTEEYTNRKCQRIQVEVLNRTTTEKYSITAPKQIAH